MLGEADVSRFEGKIDRSVAGDCWAWRGTRDRYGYGKFTARGRQLKAHRIALALAGVAVPARSVVCHTCDHPWCVNPGHLYVGTQRQNVADMHARGRAPVVDRSWARGEGNPCAILTTEKADAIRALRASGMAVRTIADVVGCSKSAAMDVLSGRTWRCGSGCGPRRGGTRKRPNLQRSA